MEAEWKYLYLHNSGGATCGEASIRRLFLLGVQDSGSKELVHLQSAHKGGKEWNGNGCAAVNVGTNCLSRSANNSCCCSGMRYYARFISLSVWQQQQQQQQPQEQQQQHNKEQHEDSGGGSSNIWEQQCPAAMPAHSKFDICWFFRFPTHLTQPRHFQPPPPSSSLSSTIKARKMCNIRLKWWIML